MKHPIFDFNTARCGHLPDKRLAEDWIESLFYWLFSVGEDYSDLKFFLAREADLRIQLSELLRSAQVSGEETLQNTETFFLQLIALRKMLEDDLETVFNYDPAAKSRNEVLLSYPGFFAIYVYRISHWLLQKGIPLLPRLLSEYVHSKTGIDIHPGAQIGKRFFIDHGTGVVIGETTKIGDDVKLYQGVTLGSLTVSKDKAEQKRHPTIGDDVVIYANATILGGDTCIGSHSTIGGNVWITHSVPEHSMVYHRSDVVVRDNSPFPEPLNFVI